jgi:TRAP transporter TAXI family solute receptor
MDSTLARTGLVTALIAGLAIVALAVTHRAQQLDREGRIVIATGNSHYYELAEHYQRDLRRNGVNLEIRRTTEGFGSLKLLVDDNSGLTAAFIKGGLVGSMQGRLAGEKGKDWRRKEVDKLRSVGRLFYEPIWVFTRGDMPIASLRDLKGKKILTGTRDSGTRRIANQLLRANGIDRTNATRVEGDLDADAAQLKSGEVDAAVLILPADSEKIQKLLRLPDIRLMDFSQEAEAYANRFPAMTRVVLRQGVVEFNPLIPTDDITLLATTVALVVRADMEPALVSLLTHAVVSNPKSGFDRQGDPVLFYKAGEFPSVSDPEFEVAPDARVVYRTNELPFMLRLMGPINMRMGVPFSYTAFASNHAAKLVLLIPLLAVLLPLLRAIPALYVWSVRRRLVYWYSQLKALEKALDAGMTRYDSPKAMAELDRIDTYVRRIWVPNYFSNQLYDLRGHIDLVRRRLETGAGPMRIAAE